jgi:hypothetical protein
MRATLLLLLAACSESTLSGTAVGNVDATLRVLTPFADDVTDLSGTLELTEARIVDCDGNASMFVAGVAISLTGESTLTLPAGSWCGLVLEPAAPATWSGTSTSGYAFDLQLDLGVLAASRAIPFDTTGTLPMNWQMGDKTWLRAQDFGADEGDVAITPASEEHDRLAEEARVAVIYRDDNNDDRPGPGEDDLDPPEQLEDTQADP